MIAASRESIACQRRVAAFARKSLSSPRPCGQGPQRRARSGPEHGDRPRRPPACLRRLCHEIGFVKVRHGERIGDEIIDHMQRRPAVIVVLTRIDSEKMPRRIHHRDLIADHRRRDGEGRGLGLARFASHRREIGVNRARSASRDRDCDGSLPDDLAVGAWIANRALVAPISPRRRAPGPRSSVTSDLLALASPLSRGGARRSVPSAQIVTAPISIGPAAA